MRTIQASVLLYSISILPSLALGSDPIENAPFCRDIKRYVSYDRMSTEEGEEIRRQNAQAMERLGETIGRFCSNKYGLNLDRVKHCMASRSLDYAKMFANLAKTMEDGTIPPEAWK